LPRRASEAAVPFSVIYEVPTDEATAEIKYAPPPLAPSSGYSHQQSRLSTGTPSTERQLSILDPL
jgi:hypothetical protein